MRRMLAVFAAALVLAACQPPDDSNSSDGGDANVPKGCAAVDVASSPEKVELLTQLAASFNDSAMNAARNGLNQSLAKVLQICGKPFQMNSSCSKVGVARKIQL